MAVPSVGETPTVVKRSIILAREDAPIALLQCFRGPAVPSSQGSRQERQAPVHAVVDTRMVIVEFFVAVLDAMGL